MVGTCQSAWGWFVQRDRGRSKGILDHKAEGHGDLAEGPGFLSTVKFICVYFSVLK